MPAVVNLAEEVVHGVLQAAEHLKGSVVAAESGAVEALRWAGALPLLLRDLSVTKLVSTEALWSCRSKEQVATLLRSPRHGMRVVRQQSAGEGGEGEEEERDAHVEPIEHLVVIVTGFLWDYEANLSRLLQFGVVQRLTLCSSLSERAHECYDFENSALTQGRVKKMNFDEFAAAIEVHNTFQMPTKSSPPQQKKKAAASPLKVQSSWSEKEESADDEEGMGGDDEWGWSEETPAGGDGGNAAAFSSEPASAAVADLVDGSAGVNVTQLPLNYASLLSSKVHLHEPSVFVLCHPICAAAFPLLLSHVVNADGTLASPASLGTPSMTYSHVKEVEPEHIPSEFRRSLKLLAHTLGEMLVNMRLEFKERIFTIGATSLKIGHTLVRLSYPACGVHSCCATDCNFLAPLSQQRIVNELHEDMSVQAVQRHQVASVLLIDRLVPTAQADRRATSPLWSSLPLDVDPLFSFAQNERFSFADVVRSLPSRSDSYSFASNSDPIIEQDEKRARPEGTPDSNFWQCFCIGADCIFH